MFGLTYHRKSKSNLIPFAAAVSRRITKIQPLRLTNNDTEEASVSFDNSFNGGVTQLQYRRNDTDVFEHWGLSALTIAPGEYIEIVGDNSETQGFLGQFSMNGNNIEASGNVMSLIYGTKMTEGALVIPDGISFGNPNPVVGGMFKDCSSLTTAPELPATTLVEGCYGYMFRNCSSLTAAPELPATTLADGCYEGMFQGCSSLTTAPELPATTLADDCYERMFQGCSSLTTAPELPATTLAERCYEYMLSESGLTTAPELPATTLAKWCYFGMFNGCSNLTAAPELPATRLEQCCYESMFSSCSRLASITVRFTLWNEDDLPLISQPTVNWCTGIGLREGVFICPPDLEIKRGRSYIPNNWTVITE